MRKFYHRILTLGVDRYQDEFDRRRVRLTNFLIFWALIVIIPSVITISLIQRNTEEFYSTLLVLVVLITGLYLNYKGYNQPGIISIILIMLCVIWYVLFQVPFQTGAPYGNLIIALVSVLLIKKRKIRLLLLTVAIASYIAANYIQLKYRIFDDTEYIPITAVLFLLFLGILYYDRLMVSYQEKIKQQSADLLRLETEKHEARMELKQKDLEMMLVSTSARDQLTENLSSQLKEVLASKDLKKGLQKVIHELNAQSELINKQTLINQNIEEINAEFYSRLLSQYPGLSKSERELCAYLKLSLSNKEIAAIKNSTENSVNVSKARLRKKLGIATNKELAIFLVNF